MVVCPVLKLELVLNKPNEWPLLEATVVFFFRNIIRLERNLHTACLKRKLVKINTSI